MFPRLLILRSTCRTAGGASCLHDSQVSSGIASAEESGKRSVHGGDTTTTPVVPGAGHCIRHCLHVLQTIQFESEAQLENDVQMHWRRQMRKYDQVRPVTLIHKMILRGIPRSGRRTKTTSSGGSWCGCFGVHWSVTAAFTLGQTNRTCAQKQP